MLIYKEKKAPEVLTSPNAPFSISASGSSGTLGSTYLPSTNGGVVDYDHFYFPGAVAQSGTSAADRNSVRRFWADTADGSATLGITEVRFQCYTEALEIIYKAQSNDMRVYVEELEDTQPTLRLALDTNDTNIAPGGQAWPGNNGTKYYLYQNQGAQRRMLNIKVQTYGYFYGVNLYDANSVIFPAVRGIKDVPQRAIIVGDSFTIAGGAGAPYKNYISVACEALGIEPVIVGSGGTGLLASGSGKMRYGDRIVPPGDTWKMTSTLSGATSVTFTYDGSTTASIAYSSNNQTFATSINSALLTTFGADALGRPNAEVYFNNHGWIFLGREGTGVKPTVTPTGGTGTFVAGDQWLGDVDPNIPRDGTGAKKPALLIVQLSANDQDEAIADVVTAFEEMEAAVAATHTTLTLIVIGPPISTQYLANTAGTGGISKVREMNEDLYASAVTNLAKVNGFVPYVSWWDGDYSAAGYQTDDWFSSTQCQAWFTQDDDVHPTDTGHYVAGRRLAAYLSIPMQYGI